MCVQGKLVYPPLMAGFSISIILTLIFFVCVRASVCNFCKIWGMGCHILPYCLHQCEELHLASCADYFSRWQEAWFEKKSFQDFFTGNVWNHTHHNTTIQYCCSGKFGPSFCVSENDNYSCNNKWICISLGTPLHHYLSYYRGKGNFHALFGLLSTKEQMLCYKLGYIISDRHGVIQTTT